MVPLVLMACSRTLVVYGAFGLVAIWCLRRVIMGGMLTFLFSSILENRRLMVLIMVVLEWRPMLSAACSLVLVIVVVHVRMLVLWNPQTVRPGLLTSMSALWLLNVAWRTLYRMGLALRNLLIRIIGQCVVSWLWVVVFSIGLRSVDVSCVSRLLNEQMWCLSPWCLILLWMLRVNVICLLVIFGVFLGFSVVVNVIVLWVTACVFGLLLLWPALVNLNGGCCLVWVQWCRQVLVVILLVSGCRLLIRADSGVRGVRMLSVVSTLR